MVTRTMKLAFVACLLIFGPAAHANTICPTDYRGVQVPNAVCWKLDKDGLYRRWKPVGGFQPGPTMKIENGKIKTCNYAGNNCKNEGSF